MIKRTFPVLMLALAAGCASEPVIDMRGVDEGQYRQDLAECREYAEQVDAGEAAVKRGAVGAAVGGAIGAVVGNHETAEKIAGVGAVTGSTRGAARAYERKERILFNCLKGRGYRVLG